MGYSLHAGQVTVADGTDEAAAAWAGAWLASPARPQVAVQWRHDESRARLLVRVDQLHAAQIYPIVLLLKFKSVKQIKEVRKTFALTK